MAEPSSELKRILGEERFEKITNLENDNQANQHYTNANEIFCECKTLILRPNHAKLIIPSDSMLEIEKQLKFLSPTNNSFQNLVRGCYWLVDDMYKFEQMGYTKELSAEHLQKLAQNRKDNQTPEQESQQSQTFQEPNNQQPGSNPHGLRYLVCAECNLCPLGWFDPKSKESYLYVW